MDGFSIGKILAGLRNPEIYLKKLKQQGDIGTNTGFNNSLTSNTANINIIMIIHIYSPLPASKAPYLQTWIHTPHPSHID